MQDVSLDVTSWEEEEASLKTKWRFRCVLGLPWKPTLAAAGVSERLLVWHVAGWVETNAALDLLSEVRFLDGSKVHVFA